MKNKLKIYSKTLIFFFGVFILLLNCEKENFAEQSSSELDKQGTQVDYLSFLDLPEIINTITTITGQTSLKSTINGNKSIQYKKASININKILKVKNKDNITNYTFGIEVEDAPINEFYNLIINENSKGKIQTVLS